MIEVYKKPLFWWVVKLFFPDVDFDKTAFAFGRKVYTSRPLEMHEIVHEGIHLQQQHFSVVVASFIFVAYVLSKHFRLSSELEAYQAQLEYIRETESPMRANIAKYNFAKHLASPLYGNLITVKKAMELL